MSASSWPIAFALLLKHEGGYVNHPQDPGGRTNLGVTQRVWEEWIGHPATEADIRALTPGMVEPLYRERYWDKVRGDDLPAGVDLAVFDYAVNSGPGRAAKTLQEVVGVAADGAVGPKTLRAARAYPADQIIIRIADAREAFLRGLPHWPTFGVGWLSRVLAVRREALEIARQVAHRSPPA